VTNRTTGIPAFSNFTAASGEDEIRPLDDPFLNVVCHRVEGTGLALVVPGDVREDFVDAHAHSVHQGTEVVLAVVQDGNGGTC
jgi:hypothetical protein